MTGDRRRERSSAPEPEDRLETSVESQATVAPTEVATTSARKGKARMVGESEP